MVGYEKYLIENMWSPVKEIIPAESRLFGLITDSDDTDTPSNAKNNPNSDVRYKHNSLGYRGEEPEWFSPNVVFVGDENTKCVGVDDAHMWTTMICKNRGEKQINFGRSGASNEWIFAQALRLIEMFQPRRMVVQWTDTRRYMYVSEKKRYYDFHPDREIKRESLFVPNHVERSRKTFYEIDTFPNGVHRLLLNVTVLDELAKAMEISMVHVFSFLTPERLKKIEGRVPVTSILHRLDDHSARDGIHCGNADMFRLTQMVEEKFNEIDLEMASRAG